ncbi:hypothetical protein L1049_019988 [Liquidambar formosana]|uniref:FAF domain-containing protein n=1 Tax=Liquidambar formosana TaxID=63359 RepID=A0AAP0SAN1_LIQFO
MMTFCKKSVHSLLTLSTSKDNGTIISPCRSRNLPSPVDGLSLIAVARDAHRPANVVESSVVKSRPTTTTSTSTLFPITAAVKKDAGGIGFIDDVGGEVNGLMSCTESLGFESSDERRTDEQIDEMNGDSGEFCSTTRSTTAERPRRKKKLVRREAKKFPPPISWLNQNGQPSFFLRAVRKDGRLELSEVRIDRPEILRASRQDGRLRLHLICDDNIETEDVKEEEEEEEDVEEKVEQEKEEKIEEDKIGEWVFPDTNRSGGDGFRWCHELINHHHNHHSNLQVWSQPCVTTR